MRLIAHRGNISGPNPSDENKTSYIQRAIDKGYDVEIDVWFIDGSLYLGHDCPSYPVDLSWLLEKKERIWVHAKNFKALSLLLPYGLRIFYHQTEKHTIIGNTGTIWSCDINEANEKSVVPLMTFEEIEKYRDIATGFYAVCSDYIGDLSTLEVT